MAILSVLWNMLVVTGLWVPGDCLPTQTNIVTINTPQSSDSDRPGDPCYVHTVMELMKEKQYE